MPEETQAAGSRCYGAEKFWKAVENSCKQHNKARPSEKEVKFNKDKKDKFIQCFEKYYAKIKDEFMTEDTEALDCHKQIAIFLLSVIESQALSQEEEEGKVALGPYAVALNVAISFLEGQINKRVKKIGRSIKKLELPYPIACRNSYFSILCRLLYYEDAWNQKRVPCASDLKFQILDWSDRFFLLEYIVLQQNKIDPLLLNETIKN